jgi:hypothetical protein
VVVAVLFKAGDHKPEYPLIEVVGSGASVPPAQIGALDAKVGVIFGLTVMDIVVVLAHCPDDGVKVYVVVAVVFKAGDQIPVMLLLEVVGKADNTPPAQIGLTVLKTGVIEVAIVTVLLLVHP